MLLSIRMERIRWRLREHAMMCTNGSPVRRQLLLNRSPASLCRILNHRHSLQLPWTALDVHIAASTAGRRLCATYDVETSAVPVCWCSAAALRSCKRAGRLRQRIAVQCPRGNTVTWRPIESMGCFERFSPRASPRLHAAQPSLLLVVQWSGTYSRCRRVRGCPTELHQARFPIWAFRFVHECTHSKYSMSTSVIADYSMH